MALLRVHCHFRFFFRLALVVAIVVAAIVIAVTVVVAVTPAALQHFNAEGVDDRWLKWNPEFS